MKRSALLVLLAALGTLFLHAVTAWAQTPSPALLVLLKGENALAIVDPSNLKIVGRVPTGDGPHEVTASADGRLAFVTNYGAREPGKTISVIDLVARKELRRVDLGALRGPHGIAFTDGKVYFTAELNKLIARYDPASDRVDWLLGTGQNFTHMLVLSQDLNRIFTSNIGSDSVTAIERTSDRNDWNEIIIPVGKGPEGIDMAPDGKEVWAANSGDGSVSIIETASNKVVQTLNLHTKRSNRLKFSPDGKLVLISDMGGGELIVMDAVARKERKRINLGHSPEGIFIVPDGSRAFVAVSGDNKVAQVDLKSLDVTARIETGKDPDGLAWAQSKLPNHFAFVR